MRGAIVEEVSCCEINLSAKPSKIMNCSALSIETPVKASIREKIATPVKQIDKRFTPSKTFQTLLGRIDRVHKYQFHTDFQFDALTEIEITQDMVTQIKLIINSEEPDSSDLVLKIEEISIREGKFSTFIKMYIAEEFQVDPSYSFLILCVLNYMKSYEMKFEMAMFELGMLSDRETLCQLCIDGGNEADKVKMANMHNFNIYRNLGADKNSDLSSGDDSCSDKTYVVKEGSDYSSRDHDIFEFREEPEINKQFNPYESSGSEHSSADTGPQMNSTEVFNPFEEAIKTPEVRKKQKGPSQCEFCERDFSNTHNLKLHHVRKGF